MKPKNGNGKSKVRFDEPELERAWNKAIELSKKNKTKYKY